MKHATRFDNFTSKGRVFNPQTSAQTRKPIFQYSECALDHAPRAAMAVIVALFCLDQVLLQDHGHQPLFQGISGIAQYHRLREWAETSFEVAEKLTVSENSRIMCGARPAGTHGVELIVWSSHHHAVQRVLTMAACL